MFVPLIIIFGSIVLVLILFLVKNFLVPKRLDTIKELIKQGKTAQAVKIAKGMITKDHRNVGAHFLLGEAYVAEQKPELALMEFKSINQIGKFGEYCLEVPFRKQIATLYSKYNQVDEALKEYLLLIKLEPFSAEHFFHAGELFEERDNSEKSVNYYMKTIQLDKNHADAHYRLGYLFYRQKKILEAKAELDIALRFNPDNYEAYFYRGKILKENSDYVAALQNFEKSQKEPELKLRSLVERGSCYIKMNNIQQAIYELSRAIKLSDSETTNITLYARYFLAYCYEKIRNLDKAIEQWELIYAKKPSFRDVAEKLSQYQDLRTDDRIKDFITSHSDIFQDICKNVVKAMKLEIRDIDDIPNGCQIIASEAESKWRNARKMPKIIWFLRVTEMVNETNIRIILEKMKNLKITRSIIITSANFSRMAIEYAESRPIELYDKERLKDLLGKIEMD